MLAVIHIGASGGKIAVYGTFERYAKLTWQLYERLLRGITAGDFAIFKPSYVEELESIAKGNLRCVFERRQQ